MSAKKATEASVPAQAVPTLLQKLLQIRQDLRNGDTQLSKHFNLYNGFDAFSVHLLAGGIEPMLNASGIISETQVLKWHRNGNITVVECRFDLVDTETGETRSYLTIGEGADGSDKGVGKAISNARKQAHIQALNLALGVDVEDADVKSQGVTQMSGAPAYAPTNYAPAQTSFYKIDLPNGAHRDVAEIDLIPAFIETLNVIDTPDAVLDFINRNEALAVRLQKEGRGDLGGTIENAIAMRLETLSASVANAA